MKRLLLLLTLAASGCSNVPKDALIRNLDIGATPWTPTMKAEVIATGKAAANLSDDERKAIVSKK